METTQVQFIVTKEHAAEALQYQMDRLLEKGATIAPFARGIRDTADSHRSIIWIDYTTGTQDAITE